MDISTGFRLTPRKNSLDLSISFKIKEGKVQDIVDSIQSTDFNLQANNLDKLSKILKNYSVKKRRTKKDIIERTRMQQEIAQLSEKVNVLSDKNRRLKLQSFKNKTPDYRKILKRIKSDLRENRTTNLIFKRNSLKTNGFSDLGTKMYFLKESPMFQMNQTLFLNVLTVFSI